MRIEIDRLPWVSVLVNGKGPYAFGVDTGYLGFCLSADVAAELGLAESKDGLASLSSLALCGLEFRDFQIMLRDNSAVSKGLGRHVDGLMGMGFLKYFETTIDYPASSISLVPLARLIGQWPAPRSGTSCVRIKYPNRYVVVPVHIGKSGPHDFLLDTGAAASVVSPELAEELRLPTDGSALARGAANTLACQHCRVGSISLGKRSMADMPMVAMDCSRVSESAGASIHGYLGHDFLKGTAVTINVLDLVLSLTD